MHWYKASYYYTYRFYMLSKIRQLPLPNIGHLIWSRYCFARYCHGKDISMITENHSFSSYISFYSMMKVSFARQSLYRFISSAWNVACNNFSVLKLCLMWLFNRVHGNTFPWYCWCGANNEAFHPLRFTGIIAEYLCSKIMVIVQPT